MSEYKELIDYSNKLNVILFATPFDLKSVEFLEKLNMPLYKMASADLRNLPLQREIAKTKKPILLSTGGGTLEDVKRAKNNICEIIAEKKKMQTLRFLQFPVLDRKLLIEIY